MTRTPPRRGLVAALRYGLAWLAASVSLAATYLLNPDGVWPLYTFLLSVLISAWFGGLGPGVLAALLSSLAIAFLRTPAGIVETRVQVLPSLVTLLTTALIFGLSSEARRRAEHGLLKAQHQLEDRVQELTARLDLANQQSQGDVVDRKQDGDALSTSEARLQAATHAANIGLWDWDLATGLITWIGHTEPLFGFAPGEFDGTYPCLEKHVHPDDRAELNRVLQRARDVRSEFAHEYRVVWPDGSVHWMSSRGTFSYDANGQPTRMCAAVLDICERMQAEERLRESEVKLKQAQQLAKIGYWERDVKADLITCSEVTEAIFSVPPGSRHTQAELQQMIHPEDRRIQQRALDEALQGGHSYDVEYRVIRPDGGLRFVHVRDEVVCDEAGRPIRMFGAVQDVTELKQAERELRRHAARMEVVADLSRTLEEAGLDYERLLSTVARRTSELIGDACVVTLFSDDQQRVYPVAFHHPNRQALATLQDTLLHAWHGEVDAEPFNTVLAGESIFLPETTAQEAQAILAPRFEPLVETLGVSSMLIVPLRIPGQVIGALGLVRNRHGDPYTRDDLHLMQILADGAALVIQNARLFQSVSQQRDRLRALSTKLLRAQEEERKRIARELHDEVGQILTGLQLSIEIDSRSSGVAAKSHLAEAQALVAQLIDRMRELSLDLRPATLDDLGLMPALMELFDRYTRQVGIRVRFNHRGIDRRFSFEVETTAYRVIQEGLTNAARHAGVQEIAVHVWADATALGVQVEDEGKGFDVPAAFAAHASTGLSGMQERAALLGGQLTIDSAPGKGTQVTMEVPLQPIPAPHKPEDSARSGG